MSSSNLSPLEKIVFIQRVLRFSSKSPQRVLIHSYVSSEWMSTVNDYSFTLLMLPFFNTPPQQPQVHLTKFVVSKRESKTLYEAFAKLLRYENARESLEREEATLTPPTMSFGLTMAERSLLYFRDVFEKRFFHEDSPPTVEERREAFTVRSPDILKNRIFGPEDWNKNIDDTDMAWLLVNLDLDSDDDKSGVINSSTVSEDPPLRYIPPPFTSMNWFRKKQYAKENELMRKFIRVALWILSRSHSTELIISLAECLHHLLFTKSLEDFHYLSFFFRFDHFHFVLQAIQNRNNPNAFSLLEQYFFPYSPPIPTARQHDANFNLRQFTIDFRDKCSKLVSTAILANNIDLLKLFLEQDPRFGKRFMNLKESRSVLLRWTKPDADFTYILQRAISFCLTETGNTNIFEYLLSLRAELEKDRDAPVPKSLTLTSDQLHSFGFNFPEFYQKVFLRDDVRLVQYFLEKHPESDLLDPRRDSNVKAAYCFDATKPLFLMAIYLGAVNCVEYYCHFAHTVLREQFAQINGGAKKTSDIKTEITVGTLHRHQSGSCTNKHHRRRRKRSRDSPLHYAVRFSSNVCRSKKWCRDENVKHVTTMKMSEEEREQFDLDISLKLVSILLKYSKSEEEVNAPLRLSCSRYLMFGSRDTTTFVHQFLDHRGIGPLHEAIRLRRFEAAQMLAREGGSRRWLEHNYVESPHPYGGCRYTGETKPTPQEMIERDFKSDKKMLKKWVDGVLNVLV